MDSDRSVGWDTTYGELKRRVDYQIEVVDKIEKRAHQLLRVLLASMSVALTGVYIFISVLLTSVNTNKMDEVFQEFLDVSPLTQRIENVFGLGGTNAGETVALILLIITIVSLFQFLIKTLIDVPMLAFELWNAKSLEPGLSTMSLERISSYPSYDEERLIEKYTDIIESNQSEVNKYRETWSKCRDALKRGIAYFAVGVFGTTFLFVFQNPYFAVLSILIVSGVVFVRAVQSIGLESMKSYLLLSKLIDIMTIFYIVVFGGLIKIILIKNPNNLIYIAAFVLSALAAFIGVYYKNIEEGKKLLSKYITALFLSWFIFFLSIFTFATVPIDSFLGWIVIYSAATLVIITFVVANLMIFFSIKFIWENWDKLLQRWEDRLNESKEKLE